MAGFHLVHDIYVELIKLECELRDLYEYSVRELLFILKYKREGLAYKIWRSGSMNRAAYGAKTYPDLNKALPELFEKQQSAPLPDWLREDYENKLNAQFSKK